MLYLKRPSALFSQKRVPLDLPVVLSWTHGERFTGHAIDLSVTGMKLRVTQEVVTRFVSGHDALLDVPVQRASLLGVKVRVVSIEDDVVDVSFVQLTRASCILVQALMKLGRRLRRTAVVWPVRLTYGERRLSSVTLDATENGLCVAVTGTPPFESGDRVRVKVDLPDGGVVDAMGEVTAGGRPGTIPLRLYGIESAGSQRLRACLAGVQDSASKIPTSEELLLTRGRG